jgi:hypothetical protein
MHDELERQLYLALALICSANPPEADWLWAKRVLHAGASLLDTLERGDNAEVADFGGLCRIVSIDLLVLYDLGWLSGSKSWVLSVAKRLAIEGCSRFAIQDVEN